MSASVTRQAETLVFAGALDRDGAVALWPAVQPLLAGVRRLDLGAVTRVDSAGLALLAELASQAGAVEVHGQPPGLAELRAAYRLQDDLSFAS